MGVGRRFYHRADANAGPIWKYARRLGASVAVLTNVGGGCPDGYIGFQGRDIGFADIKGDKEDLRDSQKDFIARWRGGPIHILRTADDLVRLLFKVPDHPFDLGDRFRYEVWRVDVVTGDRVLVPSDPSVPFRAAKFR